MGELIHTKTISRRSFLIKCGWVAGGVTILSSCSSILPTLPSMNEPEDEDAFSWIQMLPDGRILFYSPRMEMGQGATLGLCQIVAEELNIGQSEIECVIPNTGQTPPFKMTVGSEGLANYFEPVAFGAATLREKLRLMVADQSNSPISEILDTQNGFILADGTKKYYGELVGGGNH